MPPKAQAKPKANARPGLFGRLLGRSAAAPAPDEEEYEYYSDYDEDSDGEAPPALVQTESPDDTESEGLSDLEPTAEAEHTIRVTSVDHSGQEDGLYFNFDHTDAHGLYLGQTQTLKVTLQRPDGEKEERRVKVFAATNGGSTGSAHGRVNPLEDAEPGQWEVGDILMYELRERVVGPKVDKVGLVFSSVPPSRVLVERVVPDTWAARKGFRANDEIVEVNGYLASYLSFARFKYEMHQRPLRLVLAAQDEDANNKAWTSALMAGEEKWSGKHWVWKDVNITDELAQERKRLEYLQNPDKVMDDILKDRSKAPDAATLIAQTRLDQIEEKGFVPEELDAVDYVEVHIVTAGRMGIAFHGTPPMVPRVVGFRKSRVPIFGIRIGSELIAVNRTPVERLRRHDYLAALQERPLTLGFRKVATERPYILPYGVPHDARQHAVLRPLRAPCAYPLPFTFELEVNRDEEIVGLYPQAWPPATVRVRAVVPGSAAQLQGVLPDDEVISVNGRPTHELSAEQMDDMMKTRPLSVSLLRIAGSYDGLTGVLSRRFGESIGALGLLPASLPPRLPIVKSVVSGSGGELAGARPGDAIFRIDGVHTLTMTPDAYTKALMKRPVTVDFLRGPGLQAAATFAAVEKFTWGEEAFEAEAGGTLPGDGEGHRERRLEKRAAPKDIDSWTQEDLAAARRAGDLDQLADEAPRGESMFDALCTLFPQLDGLPAGQIAQLLERRGCADRRDILEALRNQRVQLANVPELRNRAADEHIMSQLQEIIEQANGLEHHRSLSILDSDITGWDALGDDGPSPARVGGAIADAGPLLEDAGHGREASALSTEGTLAPWREEDAPGHVEDDGYLFGGVPTRVALGGTARFLRHDLAALYPDHEAAGVDGDGVSDARRWRPAEAMKQEAWAHARRGWLDADGAASDTNASRMPDRGPGRLAADLAAVVQPQGQSMSRMPRRPPGRLAADAAEVVWPQGPNVRGMPHPAHGGLAADAGAVVRQQGQHVSEAPHRPHGRVAMDPAELVLPQGQTRVPNHSVGGLAADAADVLQPQGLNVWGMPHRHPGALPTDAAAEVMQTQRHDVLGMPHRPNGGLAADPAKVVRLQGQSGMPHRPPAGLAADAADVVRPQGPNWWGMPHRPHGGLGVDAADVIEPQRPDVSAIPHRPHGGLATDPAKVVQGQSVMPHHPTAGLAADAADVVRPQGPNLWGMPHRPYGGLGVDAADVIQPQRPDVSAIPHRPHGGLAVDPARVVLPHGQSGVPHHTPGGHAADAGDVMRPQGPSMRGMMPHRPLGALPADAADLLRPQGQHVSWAPHRPHGRLDADAAEDGLRRHDVPAGSQQARASEDGLRRADGPAGPQRRARARRPLSPSFVDQLRRGLQMDEAAEVPKHTQTLPSHGSGDEQSMPHLAHSGHGMFHERPELAQTLPSHAFGNERSMPRLVPAGHGALHEFPDLVQTLPGGNSQPMPQLVRSGHGVFPAGTRPKPEPFFPEGREDGQTDFEAAQLMLELGAGEWHGREDPVLRGREEAKRSSSQFNMDVRALMRELRGDHVLPGER